MKCQRHFVGVWDHSAVKKRDSKEAVFILRREAEGLLGTEGHKDVAAVQRALPGRSVATGGFIRRHVRLVGHVDFPAPAPAGGRGEGVSPLHLRGHTGCCVVRAAARGRRARRALPHAAPELCGRVSPAQLFFNRALQRRAGY